MNSARALTSSSDESSKKRDRGDDDESTTAAGSDARGVVVARKVASSASSGSTGSRLPQIPKHYFMIQDIVWVRPAGFPFWPAEVVEVDAARNTVTCTLFHPPPQSHHHRQQNNKKKAEHSIRCEDEEHIDEEDVCTSSSSSSAAAAAAPPPSPPASTMSSTFISPATRVFYFDKISSEEELQAVVEDRLQRARFDVSAYEFAFVAAVRRANSLVRIVLNPSLLQPFSVCGVGVVHSYMRTHVSAPRQPSTAEFSPQTAVIVLRSGLENAVRDLAGFERIWVLFHFSYAVGLKQDRQGADGSTGWKTMIVPPRDTVARGVFATRSPHRPNSIGLSCVRLLRVSGLEVHIADHDLLHGTPVLDIKPYLPFCDAHPNAKAGWVQDLDERGAGLGDHRGAVNESIAVHRNFDCVVPEEDTSSRVTATEEASEGHHQSTGTMAKKATRHA